MSNEWSNKKFGFGLMRLPRIDGEIDIPAVAKMADTFLARGFTYFDTAYVYGGSEVAFREAVVKRHPRESFTVASKMAGWNLSETLTPEVMFNESLERCGVTYFDYYLLHSLQPGRIKCYDEYDCWNFCKEMKRQGKIKNLGFSFHGGPEMLDQLLTAHPDVDFVQLQINYADWNSGAICSRENYEVCRRHNKDIVVMEPVKGGILATVKPELMEIYNVVKPGASAASFALRFAASLPGVKIVLSGMNSDEQIEDNLSTFENFVPLSDEEQKAVEAVRDGILAVPVVPCTSCRYCCDGCPSGINIPDVFKANNMLMTFGEHPRPHFYYAALLEDGSGKASDCIGCGQCETACPQHINIIASLKEAAARLDK